MINTIHENKWAHVPDRAWAQFFLQRCEKSEAMEFHQDPGEDYEGDKAAGFTLILMLSKKNDPEHGWKGGKLKIKAGLPADECDDADVTVLELKHNQALIFNNKLNSHAVTKVSGIAGKTKRDLMVVTLYLTGLPKPIRLPSRFYGDLGGEISGVCW
jgi:hypothetical protein